MPSWISGYRKAKLVKCQMNKGLSASTVYRFYTFKFTTVSNILRSDDKFAKLMLYFGNSHSVGKNMISIFWKPIRKINAKCDRWTPLIVLFGAFLPSSAKKEEEKKNIKAGKTLDHCMGTNIFLSESMASFTNYYPVLCRILTSILLPLKTCTSKEKMS